MSALSTDEDQVHPVLGWVSESHSLVVETPLTSDIFATRQSRVFYTLFVHMEFLRKVSLLTLVDTVIRFIILLRTFKVTANPAVIDQSCLALLNDLFTRLKHVVALTAKAHSFVGHF
jgi:hypothetical protein